MPCKHRGSGSSSPVSSLRLSRFCDSSIQELWSLPPLCRGTAQTWRGWMMSGHQEVGGPGRHPLLLPGGAVLGWYYLRGTLVHVLQEIWVRMAMRGLFKSNVKNAYKGSNLGLRHYRQILYCLSHQGRVCVLVAQSCLTLCDPIDFTHQAPLSMGSSDMEGCTGAELRGTE